MERLKILEALEMCLVGLLFTHYTIAASCSAEVLRKGIFSQTQLQEDTSSQPLWLSGRYSTELLRLRLSRYTTHQYKAGNILDGRQRYTRMLVEGHTRRNWHFGT